MSRQRKRYYRDMTPLKADLMRRLYFYRICNQREIAEIFGCRQGSVSRIVSEKVWTA